MQAIVTKYLPATNTKGARIKAQCARGSTTIAYPHESNGDDTIHRVAVYALVGKFLTEDAAKYGTDTTKNPWAKPFVTGCLPSGNYAHVFIS